MAETPVALDAAARAALDKLADVVIPPPTPWIPQTWGWAVLGVIVVVLTAWAVIRWRRCRETNRYRREALAELSRLETRLTDASSRSEALAGMPALLKRVALVAWPRPQVAALSGPAWIAFLRAHASGAELPDVALRWLQDGEYRSPHGAAATLDEARVVARAVRGWIEGHRVSA